MAKHGLHAAKAKEMLKHGEARGHKLSKKQKGLFGMIAGGGTPRQMARKLKNKKSK